MCVGGTLENVPFYCYLHDSVAPTIETEYPIACSDAIVGGFPRLPIKFSAINVFNDDGSVVVDPIT